MKKKTNNDEQLKISQFIKEPTSLKLLILAGTNIRSSELSTVSKCTGLIKLDLSSNFLGQLPLKFSQFPHIKILYLHDNQLSKIDVNKTSLEYISLFSNPIKSSEYRKHLITNNKNLLALDMNIICQKQRLWAENSSQLQDHSKNKEIKLPLYTELKWPIVQISSNLEHEDDYLNLLKAEIFVITNVHKRTNKIQIIQRIFQGLSSAHTYNRSKANGMTVGNIVIPFSVVKAAKKWKEYVRLKKKLRKILQAKGKEHLLLNRLQLMKRNRSEGINEVMDAFLPLVRKKMKARGKFQRKMKAFRQYIPAQKELYAKYLQFTQDRDLDTHPVKLYFKDSQLDILGKVILYAKKILFQQKQYDLCDEFGNLFRQTSKKFYIFRSNENYEQQRSWLINSIHNTIRLVIKQCGINRKHFLYNRKGHKQIKIKSLSKPVQKQKYIQRLERCDRKIDYIENKYDKLLQYEVKNSKILKMMLKIIRFINAGNSSTIILTETAYFQTEVHFNDDDKEQQKVNFYLGLEFFVKRVSAANIIQRFWRKKLCQKNIKISIVQQLRKKRADNLLHKWFSNIIFHHRLLAIKTTSYFSSIWRQSEVYLHLDIYMNLPQPTNFLRYQNSLTNRDSFYELFHKGTQIQIVETLGRKWLKICYPSVKEASNAQKILFKNTYRYYYNGFSLKFFTATQIKDIQTLSEYEKRVKHILGINIYCTQILQKTSLLWIDNINPYFVWSEIQLDSTRKIFTPYQKHSTNVSIFIYNKHKRPLKVSCQFLWVQPQSIYLNKRAIKSVKNDSSIKTHQNSLILKGVDNKQLINLDDSLKKNYYVDMPLRRQKERRNSLKNSVKPNSLMKSHRTRIVSDHKLDLLSETLNIRRK